MSDLDQLLYDLGITPNMKGFKYIKNAVELVNDCKSNDLRINSRVYPHIANKYDVTPCSVERAIRHAISKSINLDHGEMRELIGISPYKNRITNTEFICSLAYLIK